MHYFGEFTFYNKVARGLWGGNKSCSLRRIRREFAPGARVLTGAALRTPLAPLTN